jgi:hypothetical protein
MTTPQEPRTDHEWNGVNGHNCEDCDPESIWKCDIGAHKPRHRGHPADLTPAEHKARAHAIVDGLAIEAQAATPVKRETDLGRAKRNLQGEVPRTQYDALVAEYSAAREEMRAERSRLLAEVERLRAALRNMVAFYVPEDENQEPARTARALLDRGTDEGG